ncbi:hypothetical protein [Streptomyces sp. NBC_00078]|uniref:hypothetical protein n=1 Tax=Streptomyces sp. NBC_00078 TaxID=2975643 RepID=UPI0022537B11|nr:hypothetical protein [Streptomyces sp. NBC_00078]MCX5426098.1 hypothetical protein [Streptomyces sp. NBC_00078]
MNTSTRNRATHATPRPAARLALGLLALVHAAVPAAGAIAGAWAADSLLGPGVTGPARVACLALAAVLTLAAVDRTVTDLTDRAHRRTYGLVHGPRSWSCEDCETRITARRWTPYEAAAFEAHVSDPAAHDCTAKP